MVPCVDEFLRNSYDHLSSLLRGNDFGTMTLSITTFVILTFSIEALSIMTLSISTMSIMTFGIMTLSIKGSFVTFSINDSQHKDIQRNEN